MTLLGKELKVQVSVNEKRKDGINRDFDKELPKAQDVYTCTIEEHRRRITELNKSHAKQCDEMCLEVVEANQEVNRLRRELRIVRKGGGPAGSISRETSKRSFKSVLINIMVCLMVSRFHFLFCLPGKTRAVYY
jgi:hypothetical protein